MTDLRRPLRAYAECRPYAVSSGSPAQMAHFVTDAQADIATLAACLRECQETLSMMIAPGSIKNTTVLHAFAAATAAEAKARAIIGQTS